MVSKAALVAHRELQKANRFSNITTSTSVTSLGGPSLPEATLHELSIEAAKFVECKLKKSRNYEFALRNLELCPKLSLSDIELGAVLGRGNFGIVTEIKRIQVGKKRIQRDQDDVHQEDHPCDPFGTGQESDLYAIKMLNQKYCSDHQEFYMGIRDMAFEAHFLAAMDHPNVLKLRGLSQESKGSKSFFLVMDRLYGTLKERVEEWRCRQHLFSRGINKWLKPGAYKRNNRELLETRLKVLKGLTGAVIYLHKQHIIDRDLKPENVGFDSAGHVKLFDFGLSTEFDPSLPKPYKLTGMIGSLAFMAPEVYASTPYDESSDIYSLGLIFWKVMSLKPLFPHLTVNMLKDLVITRGVRPVLESKWSESMRNLIGLMWDKNPKKRPNAQQIHDSLSQELERLDRSKNVPNNASCAFLLQLKK